MKYIEELKAGDCFDYKDNSYIITTDFAKDGSRRCIDLIIGSNRWFAPDTIVELILIFTIDKENNIIPIKPENYNEKYNAN